MGAREEAFYCVQCQDIGLIQTEKGSRPCPCQAEREIQIRLRRAQIPETFSACRLENFWPAPHAKAALAAARRLVGEFIPGQKIRGLMFTGTIGAGKTHLASGIVRELVENKGIEARFVTVPELLEKLRASYGQDAQQSEAQILKPILRADLVVIDELGSARPTEWVFETVELLIGGLYNQGRPVIVTTNYPNLAGGVGPVQNEYARATRQETLGDRIGGRMWSRLQQMCIAIDMSGPDWRAKK